MRPGVVAVMAVVVVLAVVVVVVIMVTHHSSTSNAGGAPATPTPTAHPAKQATAGKSAAAGFTLTTPLVAGGYTKLTKVPADVTTDAGITSLDVRGAVTKAGGKVTGTAVSAAYQLDDGQVLAFTGFDGTFNPAKVIAGLTSLGTDETTQTAGPHGGMLECATESGSASGTVCVWATTTTVGVTEFFSSTGPETVSSQAKAASDTVNVRASVEVAAS